MTDTLIGRRVDQSLSQRQINDLHEERKPTFARTIPRFPSLCVHFFLCLLLSGLHNLSNSVNHQFGLLEMDVVPAPFGGDLLGVG